MKTLKKQLKTIMLLMVLTLYSNVYSQNGSINKDMFVRVYNLEGNKIGKGKVFNVTDTLLTLKKNSKYINLKPSDIGLIKSKHSAGHNVLMGSVIGGGTMAILGAASADPDAWIFGYTAAEGATAGALFGGIAGGAIGGITILFKNSITFTINGKESNWQSFVDMFK